MAHRGQRLRLGVHRSRYRDHRNALCCLGNLMNYRRHNRHRYQRHHRLHRWCNQVRVDNKACHILGYLHRGCSRLDHRA